MADSADSTQKAAFSPGEGVANAKAERFKCESCGAEQHYDASIKKLKCDFCGATRDVPKGAGAVVERDLFAGLEQLPTGLGVETNKAAKCKECGATVHFDSAKTATTCAFCGSSSILVQDENRKLLRPESLVPFGIDKKNANENFSRWLKGLWFRPNDLKHLAKVQEVAGVYVPFWTYDAHVESSWTADAGYYYYVTEEYEVEEDGNTVTKTREVRHTRWESAWGQRSDDYDDVLVCASVGLPTDLADAMKSFDTTQLVPYTPGYLAGWSAEEYAVDLQAGYGRAQEKMDAEQEKRCAGDVPGDTHRALNVSSQYSQLTFKHVLLPIWIAAYRYRGEIYRFLVNGQTGEVQGKAPYSWLKIMLAVVAALAVIAVIAIIASKHK
jgi:ribosomal protein S27E